MSLISASEAARRLDIPQTTFSRWLIEGRVKNAQKVANMWLVPDTLTEDDIDKPQMGRPYKDEKANGNCR